MNRVTYNEDLFESIPDYTETILSMISTGKCWFFRRVWFLKKVLIVRVWNFQKIIFEQIDDYLDYIKDQEEYILERILNE